MNPQIQCLPVPLVYEKTQPLVATILTTETGTPITDETGNEIETD